MPAAQRCSRTRRRSPTRGPTRPRGGVPPGASCAPARRHRAAPLALLPPCSQARRGRVLFPARSSRPAHHRRSAGPPPHQCPLPTSRVPLPCGSSGQLACWPVANTGMTFRLVCWYAGTLWGDVGTLWTARVSHVPHWVSEANESRRTVRLRLSPCRYLASSAANCFRASCSSERQSASVHPAYVPIRRAVRAWSSASRMRLFKMVFCW